MDDKSVFTDNLTRNEAEARDGAVRLGSKPLMLLVMPSTRCNLKCIMCPKTDNDTTLPLNILEKIYPLYPYLELINWGGGGEIFCLDYFKEVFIKTMVHPNIKQSITTNGLLINKEWAELLVKSNVHLTYSIDSVVPGTYEYIRKGAGFGDLLKSLALINAGRTAGVPENFSMTLNVVVMRSNCRELHLFPKFCKDNGFASLRLEYQRPVVNFAEDIFTKNADPVAMSYISNAMSAIEKECEALGIRFDSCIGPFINGKTDSLVRSGELVSKCRLPWKKLLIDAGAGGRIMPDCLCRQPIGNIYEDDLEQLWNNGVMRRYRENIINNKARGWCSDACLTYER